MALLNRVSIGRDADSDVALYIGHLEGNLGALLVSELKHRALLELITGEAWDSTTLHGDNVDLLDIAAQLLVKQTGLSPEKARELVDGRAEPLASHVLNDPVNATPELSMADRLQRWKERNTPSDQAKQPEA